MDPGYRPHGHTRSMSSLASTIVPVFFESREWASPSSVVFVDQTPADIPDELRIPLPPSVAGSEYGDSDVLIPMETFRRLDDPLGVMEVGRQTTQVNEAEHIGIETAGNSPGFPSAKNDATPPAQASVPMDSSSKSVLPSLIQILQEDGYESGRFENLQNQVQDLMSVCHVTERLVSKQLFLFRAMLNCSKTENSAAFASLYSQAIQHQELQTYPHYLPRKAHSIGYDPLAPFPDRQSSWIHSVSPEAQRGIIHLITRIRSDPKFLASYLAKLPSAHLNKLAHPHRQTVATESIVRNPTRSSSVRGNLYINPSEPKDDLEPLGDAEHDPLFLLINCMFQTSDDPYLTERSFRCDIWSTVCAQIVEEGRADSDEFCLAILDIFAGREDWPMKSQLETFLTELMQSGTSVLAPLTNQVVDFTKPTETSKNLGAAKVAGFFDNALKTLTQILTNGMAESAMPKTVLNLIHKTLSKITDPVKRTKAQKFFIRWYCTSYISNALIYPESIGIMMDCHISKDVRQKIFHELAARFQRSIFDVLSPWKTVKTGTENVSGDIVKLLGLFHITDAIDRQHVLRPIERPITGGKLYLTLSAKDTLIILDTLRPSNVSQMPLTGFFSELNLSKPPSITGSSTMTSGTDEPRTGTASSTAVSEGGTSMTSDGSSTQMYLRNLDEACSDGLQRENFLVGHINHEVDDESFLIDEHHMEIMIKELSRLVVPQDSSTGTPSVCEEDFVVLYISNHDNSLSLDNDPLDEELKNAKSILEAMLTHNVEPRLPSPDHLGYLVEGLVRMSQSNAIFHRGDGVGESGSNDPLETWFRDYMADAEACYDFQTAHCWWRCIQVLGGLASINRELLFADLYAMCRTRVETCRKAITHYEGWCAALRKRQMVSNYKLENLAIRCRGLRDKMWYSSGVKYSSNFQAAMNITCALRSMAKSAQTKATGMAAWARQRLRSSTGSDRAQQQILEALSAPKECGGPTKMSDEQVELTSRWLTRHSIENFCKGEERIHRFCLEIQKCVNKLVGESFLDSPVLWSSALYQHEKQLYSVGHGQPAIRPGNRYQSLKRHVSQGTLNNPIPNMPYIPDSSRDMLPNSRHADSYYSGLGGFSASNVPSYHPSGIFQAHSSGEGYRAHPTLPPSPLSPTFPSIHPLHSLDVSAPTQKQEFLNRLKEKLISLLLSELGLMLWNDGSETDRWINERRGCEPSELHDASSGGPVALSVDVTQTFEQIPSNRLETGQPSAATANDVIVKKSSDSSKVETDTSVQPPSKNPAFSFQQAYVQLFRNFSLSTNPHEKLRSLYEITSLIAISREPDLIQTVHPIPHIPPDLNPIHEPPPPPSMKALNIPRTRLTRLEEVMANCEERRLQSLNSNPLSTIAHNRHPKPPHSDPHILPLLQSLLRDPTLYPRTLFRDLQYIAAFVPASTLDASPLGTAFWTVGLAATSLKAHLTLHTTRRANRIVAHHYSRAHPAPATEPRRPSPSPTTSASPPLATATATDPSLFSTSLGDAARLYTLAALEGDPAAARELALFHLTHPELVRRATLPFSRPAEVFRSVASSTAGGGVGGGAGRGGGGQESALKGGLDPWGFAVAFHWMEVAANAGDGDARAFLRENGDLGRGR